jgi:hypothetical protein
MNVRVVRSFNMGFPGFGCLMARSAHFCAIRLRPQSHGAQASPAQREARRVKAELRVKTDETADAIRALMQRRLADSRNHTGMARSFPFRGHFSG